MRHVLESIMEGSCSVALWLKEQSGRVVLNVVFIDIFNIITAQYSFSNAQVIIDHLAPRQYGVCIDAMRTVRILRAITENSNVDSMTIHINSSNHQVLISDGDKKEVDVTAEETLSLDYTELFERKLGDLQRVELQNTLFNTIVTVMCLGGIQANIVLADGKLTIHSGPGPCQLSFSRPYPVSPNKESRIVLYTRYLKYLAHLLNQCQQIYIHIDKNEPLWVTGVIQNSVQVTTVVAVTSFF